MRPDNLIQREANATLRWFEEVLGWDEARVNGLNVENI